MLQISGTKYEVDIVGEIFNTVLEMLGGNADYDGFGYSLPPQFELKNLKFEMPRTFKLETSNDYEVKEQLELMIGAIHTSRKNGGLFSKKENWFEYYRSR